MLKKKLFKLLEKMFYGRYCRMVANGQRISIRQFQTYHPVSKSENTSGSISINPAVENDDVVFIPVNLTDIDVIDEILVEYQSSLKPEFKWQESIVQKLLNKFNSQRESLLQ